MRLPWGLKGLKAACSNLERDWTCCAHHVSQIFFEFAVWGPGVRRRRWNHQMEPEIKVCQRPGNIYQAHCLRSMEICGSLRMSDLKRGCGPQIVRAMMDCGKCCIESARVQKCQRSFESLERLKAFFFFRQKLSVETKATNLSPCQGTVPQTAPPPAQLHPPTQWTRAPCNLW